MNIRETPVIKYSNGNKSISTDSIASETLVKLSYNGERIANLLASPEEGDYLLKGHLISEGYVELNSFREDHDFEIKYGDSGELLVNINCGDTLLLPKQSPILTTTSCGACNTDGLDLLINNLPCVDRFEEFNLSILHRGLEEMKINQNGFSLTGGMHCSGLLSSDGKLLYFSEDIGRHNSVDKVIGKGLGNVDLNRTILLLSGRCGWDMVAKAARCNISNIAAIGACSTLAADCARAVGIKIYSFVKHNTATIIG